MREKRSELEKTARDLLKQRGVTINDIAEIVYFLQEQYFENLSLDLCVENINSVLRKREVQHAILTGIQLDILSEQNKLDEPLQNIIHRDERSEEHTSELQSRGHLVCRLLLEK